MGKFFDAIKHTVQTAAQGGGPVRHTLQGHAIVCPVCGCDRFVAGRAQLNTAGLTFFNLDWANRSAATLACGECGRLEWYLQAPEPAE
jgi:predicted nucleic-acid-binding Zn-ribbon protein